MILWQVLGRGLIDRLQIKYRPAVAAKAHRESGRRRLIFPGARASAHV
jgi:hypothetical protein